jgi:hypothetical protein
MHDAAVLRIEDRDSSALHRELVQLAIEDNHRERDRDTDRRNEQSSPADQIGSYGLPGTERQPGQWRAHREQRRGSRGPRGGGSMPPALSWAAGLIFVLLIAATLLQWPLALTGAAAVAILTGGAAAYLWLGEGLD